MSRLARARDAARPLARRGRIGAVDCSEAEVLLHALIDGELDAGHAREVEAHVATCADCRKKLADFRAMRQATTAADLKHSAPAHLRARIEAALPAPAPYTLAGAAGPEFSPRRFNRRFFVGGFAVGTALSGAIAATLVLGVLRDDQEQRIAGEVVSAHLRSLQPGHLTDVETSDQHTVKPWFNGKLDMAPPVIDLTAQGFTLIGGRLDDISGETVAAIVYRRRNHVINLFVAESLGGKHPQSAATTRQDFTRHGFNVRHWTEGGLDLWAVSDINAAELDEFCQKLGSALQAPPPRS
jgi:anti-sigma factor RsiW